MRLDTETISYNLDTVAGYEFSRVLDRSNDIHGRSKGYELKDNTMIDAKANYDYDPLTGRLETVDDGGLSQYIYGDNNFTYTYVENSTSNLIDHVFGGMVRVYNTWEPNRDILKEKENLSRTLVKNYSTFTYTTNAIGQREKVVAIGENSPNANNTAFERTWGYDSRGQLTQENDTQNDVHDRGFAYDAIGNRTKSIAGNTNVTAPGAVSYTPNALNQYSAITDPASALMTPHYDDDGNTKTSSIRPTGMPGVNLQTAIYDWDAENRLVKITRPNNTSIASYQYDAFGRRIAKKDGDNYQSIWVYDGWNPIALYGSPTDLYENYLWGLDLSGSLQGAGGVGGLLAISYSDYNVHYPTYDGNGNVSEYIEPYPDPDFYFPYDFVAAHYEYDAFGDVTNSEGWSASDFPFRFSTKQQDDESGLLYYGYRHYDPLIGRWPSRDPIEERGGMNLYGFVYNDPNDWFDDLGNEPRQQSDQKAADAERANINGRNSNKTADVANRANRGAATADEAASAPGNAASGLTELANLSSNKLKMELLERNFNKAFDKCFDKAKLIFTRGTGSKSGTTCDVCCQISLHVSWEGVTESHILKMFNGPCDENKNDRTKWLNQPSLNTPGFNANFERSYHYSQFR